MGTRPTDLLTLLEVVFACEALPDEPWALAAVAAGLDHPDAEVRELAVACAATGACVPLLQAHLVREPEPWLVRFTQLVLDEPSQSW